MEENTTVLSILVGFAGILAEIIFHDTLSASVIGVVLSVVLAVIILCCTYFAAIDIQRSFHAMHKRDERRRREYDEKLFRLLNRKLSEQIRLEKGIYALLAKSRKEGFAGNPGAGIASDAEWKEMAESINNSTLKAAKLIVKYSQRDWEQYERILGQGSGDILEAVQGVGNQLQMLNTDLQEAISRISVGTTQAADSVVPDLFEETPSIQEEVFAENAEIEETEESAEEITLSIEESMEAEEPAAEVDMDVEEPQAVSPEETEEDIDNLLNELLGGAEEIEESSEAIPEPIAEEATDESLISSESEMPEMVEPETVSQEMSDVVIPEAVPVEDLTDSEISQKIEEAVPEIKQVEPETIQEEPAPAVPEIDMSNPNKELSADEIAALFASAGGEPEASVAEKAEEAPVEPEPAPAMPELDMSNPNKELSPDEIALLFASAGDAGTDEKAPEPEPTPAPAPEVSEDPNKMMSPDDIAALIANMNS